MLLNFKFNCYNVTHEALRHTGELELRAYLARAHALDRSMRSRKKGKASLEGRTEQSAAAFNRDIKT